MKKQRTIVVLGGAQSGPTAAARARETDEHAKIVLIERASTITTAAAGLAYHLSGEVTSVAELRRESAEMFRDVYGIDVRTGAEVTRLDAKHRQLEIGGEALAFDSLICALGAESLVPEVLAGASNVFCFRTLGDLEAIEQALEAGKRRVAIVGGGFFGVEAADGLLRRGAEVVIVEASARILGGFAPAIAAVGRDALTALGARIVTLAKVAQTQRAGDAISALVLESGERIPVDLVIAAAGVAPRTALLKNAGAKLLADGSLAVDARMRTNLAGVYACGVCASVEHAVTGKHAAIAQASIADKTAQIAGANAAGAKLKMAPVLGTAIVRAGDVACARTGLPHAGVGKGVAVTRVHAPSHDAWFPGASPISIELRCDAKTGRLLGADLAGKHGVDKRVDVLATALVGGLSVEELAELDLAYAPPFSAARDAVNVAATVAFARGVRALAPSELLGARSQLSVIDVRAAGTTPFSGAIAIPLGSLRQRIAELPERGQLVFVDDVGRGAYLAACIAQQHGRTAAYLSGGLRSVALERGAE
ncbi:MAG: FAD-dependent oxidoreductase [Polyangiaceae bacterium]|nr:FAD-dependent oxidoreductase [Polyangiaceae bacterium]